MIVKLLFEKNSRELLEHFIQFMLLLSLFQFFF